MPGCKNNSHMRAAGLDARSAAVVMRAVRNIVDTGRTVVTTIHQPSIDIFEARCPAATPAQTHSFPFSLPSFLLPPVRSVFDTRTTALQYCLAHVPGNPSYT